MKTTLLLVRHGESEANLQKRFAGNWDVALTERGVLQAKLTAKYISENYSVDKIFSSDLIRAYATAQELSKMTGIVITKEKRLREIMAGEWEKRTFLELIEKFPETYVNVWKNNIGKAVCDGGESVEAVGKRTIEAIKEIIIQNEGKTVAIVTHATPIRTALNIIQGETISKGKILPWVSNASVTEVVYASGNWKIVDFSHDGHLEEAKTVLPPNV